MKNFLKSKFGTILVLVATVVLAGIAIFTAYRLYTLRQEAVAPSAPTSKPGAAGCVEQCPGTDGVLRNCSAPGGPEADGSSKDSVCNASYAGSRIEYCGGKQYCCNNSAKWTTTLTDCQGGSETTQACTALAFNITTSTSTPTPTPTATATATATPTATATATATSSTTTTTTQASLPEAGIGLPTILGLGIGTTLLIVSLLFAI